MKINFQKNLQELTIKDNFMFGAVMLEEANCRGFLEMVLGIPIQSLSIDLEKSMVYHPEYKGIRLDVIARDKANTHYNVEMQVLPKAALGQRSRYYHSQIDMELLTSGLDYSKLPNSFVIFVCDFDPFGFQKYCYTFLNRCEEENALKLDDGNVTIFLSTHGKNPQDVSEGMVRFLKFVKASLKASIADYKDDFVKQLQDTIVRIKASREMGERYMLLQELLKDERTAGFAEGHAAGLTEGHASGLAEGLAEGHAAGLAAGLAEGRKCAILETLEELEEVPAWLRQQISLENDPETLSLLSKEARHAKSLEEFIQRCQLKDQQAE